MPVTVPLLKLVAIPDTRHLWPADFDALVKACEADLAERTPWGVTADWLTENDEPDLAAGFRWVFKRPDAEIKFGYAGLREAKPLEFGYGTIPTALRHYFDRIENMDTATPAGLAAKVAEAIRLLKEEML